MKPVFSVPPFSSVKKQLMKCYFKNSNSTQNIKTLPDPKPCSCIHEMKLKSGFIIQLEAAEMKSMTGGLLTQKNKEINTIKSAARAKGGQSPLSCHGDSYREEVESHLE